MLSSISKRVTAVRINAGSTLGARRRSAGVLLGTGIAGKSSSWAPCAPAREFLRPSLERR